MRNITKEMIEAACEAQAIAVAKQDGVVLTLAGFRHGAKSRPKEHELMREYVAAGIRAALSSRSAEAGKPVDTQEYQAVHDAATAAYEASTPPDFRYSASALRKAVDAALATFSDLAAPVADIEPVSVPDGVTYRQQEFDEAYEIGKREGYEEAVQDIDQRTGGDGEYRYCLGMEDSVRHQPDPATMTQRIVDRFEVLNLLGEAHKDGRDIPDDAAAPHPTKTEKAGAVDALDGNRALPFDRDTLGQMVREAWVRWAETQTDPKPPWLAPYDELSEPDKEADRQIGEAIARWTLIGDAASRALSTTKTEAVEQENTALRQIIHECANQLPNGAFISPKASVDFMQGLPKEIALVCAGLVKTKTEAEDAPTEKVGAGDGEVLTPHEMKFVVTVFCHAGARIDNGDESHWEEDGSEYGKFVAHWDKPESLGLIERVGKYRWKPTEKLDRLLKDALTQALKSGAVGHD